MNRNARARRTVLVPEAHALGAIGVIRSLGRAGYRVVAISSDPNALGFRSNFVHRAQVAPPYDEPGYLDWLRECIAHNEISLIIPSEGFLVAVRSVFHDLRHLLPVPDRPEVLYRALSKVAVAEALIGPEADPAWRVLLPPSVIVRRDGATPAREEIARLGAPFYVKSDLGLSRGHAGALMKRCESVESVLEVLARHVDMFDAVLVQGFVPGVKAAVAFCLDANAEIVTRSAVLGLRTTPHRGGMMSLRESWSHTRMEEVGLAWLRHLEWRGVAMIECKWDPASDRFWLIEINARYWGYLHLDLYAGVDVPRLQADRFFDSQHVSPPSRKLGVRCRHAFPGDAGWLISRLKDPMLGPGVKSGSVMRFLADFADVRCRSDLYFPGDRHLYWVEAGRYLRALTRGAFRRLGTRSTDRR